METIGICMNILYINILYTRLVSLNPNNDIDDAMGILILGFLAKMGTAEINEIFDVTFKLSKFATQIIWISLVPILGWYLYSTKNKIIKILRTECVLILITLLALYS